MFRFDLRRVLPALVVLLVALAALGGHASADGPTPGKYPPPRQIVAVQQGYDISVKHDKENPGHVTFTLAHGDRLVNISRTQFLQQGCTPTPEMGWPIDLRTGGTGEILITTAVVSMTYNPPTPPGQDPISGSLTQMFPCLRWGEPVTPDIIAHIFYKVEGDRQPYYAEVKFHFGP